MRGWKPSRSRREGWVRTSRTLSPDNEGMETSLRPRLVVGAFQAGHSAPTMRGWKPEGTGAGWVSRSEAGHSAPTMRGWKQEPNASCNTRTPSRTLSPDNEGMETAFLEDSLLQEEQAGHSAPTMRGWKRGRPPCPKGPAWRAGHSAPTMRGWKLGHLRGLLRGLPPPDTQPRQ